ncbi:MAG: hypothetical protein M5U34_00635 [Chloroflexi bacterium]|nr:hypothetical protein [Chloroflexota bacterium]
MTRDIVIVDDDAFARSGLCTYLQSLGCAPRTAGDVPKRLGLILTQPPPTAVIDIRLPSPPQKLAASPPNPMAWHSANASKKPSPPWASSSSPLINSMSEK